MLPESDLLWVSGVSVGRSGGGGGHGGSGAVSSGQCLASPSLDLPPLTQSGQDTPRLQSVETHCSGRRRRWARRRRSICPGPLSGRISTLPESPGNLSSS